MTQPREVILYTRRECGLCEDAADALRPLQRTLGFTLRETDIDRDIDQAIRDRFNETIPVVMLNGRVIAEAPFDAEELSRLLEEALSA